MKTDRFTDIIRRKLESIRPEFTDKDWARMQSTLKDANLSQPNAPSVHQPFSGGIWSGQPWLVAAASISTAALIAFSVWQRREINQLRQTIGQLQTPKVQQPAPTPTPVGAKEQLRSSRAQSHETTLAESQEISTSADRHGSQAMRPDTVYITRYVAVPSRAKPETHLGQQPSQRQVFTNELKQVPETAPTTPSIAHQPTTISDNQPAESHDASFTSPSVVNTTSSESTVVSKSAGRSTKPKRAGNRATEPVVVDQNTKNSSSSVTDQTEVLANNPAKTEVTGTTETSANFESVTSRPLALSKKNWMASLSQRARRMQPTRPVVVAIAEPAKTPASQPVKPMALRFRAGISGEVASRLWSAGLFTEILLGKHLTVGIGLNEATYMNRFITEDDFNGRTQRDFRKEFGRGINAWGDILNIDTRQIRLQLPLTIGYRVPLNQTLTLITSAGTYLNLTNSESATFYCRQPQFLPMQPQPQGGLTEVEVNKTQPVALVNSLFLGAGVEWQHNHWVVQATPVITIPTQMDSKSKQTDPNWQQNTTVGLRARLLYQF